MARLTTKEVDEALALIEELRGTSQEVELNWRWMPNSALRVGMPIATKFDKKTGRAQASVKIREIDAGPRGCNMGIHVKGENAVINGCYQATGRTRVMV